MCVCVCVCMCYKRSLEVCRNFVCKKCKHSHEYPYPMVQQPQSYIKIIPMDDQVEVDNDACQTTHTYWVGAYANFGNHKK